MPLLRSWRWLITLRRHSITVAVTMEVERARTTGTGPSLDPGLLPLTGRPPRSAFDHCGCGAAIGTGLTGCQVPLVPYPRH